EVPVAVGVGEVRYPVRPHAPRVRQWAALGEGVGCRVGGGLHIGHARARRPAAGRGGQAGRGQRGGRPPGPQTRPPAAASRTRLPSAGVLVVVILVVFSDDGLDVVPVRPVCPPPLFPGRYRPRQPASPPWQAAPAPPAGPPAAVTQCETGSAPG